MELKNFNIDRCSLFVLVFSSLLLAGCRHEEFDTYNAWRSAYVSSQSQFDNQQFAGALEEALESRKWAYQRGRNGPTYVLSLILIAKICRKINDEDQMNAIESELISNVQAQMSSLSDNPYLCFWIERMADYYCTVLIPSENSPTKDELYSVLIESNALCTSVPLCIN